MAKNEIKNDADDQTEDLATRLERIERLLGPRIAADKASEQLGLVIKRAEAVGRIADPVERGRAILKLDTEGKRHAWAELEVDAVIATLDAAADPADRAGLFQSLSAYQQVMVEVWRLPIVERVIARMNPKLGRTTSINTRHINGIRKSENYAGFSLADPDMRWIETLRLWTRRLEIDAELAQYVKEGDVIVEPMPADESRRVMVQEAMRDRDGRARTANAMVEMT